VQPVTVAELAVASHSITTSYRLDADGQWRILFQSFRTAMRTHPFLRHGVATLH
jgi:hypothetical protein